MCIKHLIKPQRLKPDGPGPKIASSYFNFSKHNMVEYFISFTSVCVGYKNKQKKGKQIIKDTSFIAHLCRQCLEMAICTCVWRTLPPATVHLQVVPAGGARKVEHMLYASLHPLTGAGCPQGRPRSLCRRQT